MFVTCTFVIWYLLYDELHSYRQPVDTCAQCGELVAAYLEAGPPDWLADTVIPMCVRREEQADPA